MSEEGDNNIAYTVFCDLKEIVKVFQAILAETDETKCDFMSWRFPDKKSIAIDALQVLNDVSSVSPQYYVLLLELLIDRIHFALNLFIQNIDIRRKTKRPKNVYKPKNLSISTVIEMFWQRTKPTSVPPVKLPVIPAEAVAKTGDVDDIGSGNSDNDHVLEKLTGATQTEPSSLSACESCHMASKLVKDMLVEIEHFAVRSEVDSAITRERECMQTEIFNITQWAAMNKWMNAINIDLKALFVLYVNTLSFNKCLEKDYNELLKRNSKLDNKIDALKNQIKKLQIKLEATQQMRSDLESKNERLVEKSDELQTRINLLKDETTDTVTEITQLRADHLQKMHQVQEVNKIQMQTVQDEVVHWKNKCESLECDRRDLSFKYNGLVTKEALNTKHFETRKQELSDAMNKQQQEIQQLNSALTLARENNLKQIAEMTKNYENEIAEEKQKVNYLTHEQDDLKQQMKLLQYPDKTTTSSAKFIRGNPLEDMKGQLIANQIRMDMLLAENKKLETTITKLENLNSMFQNVPSAAASIL